MANSRKVAYVNSISVGEVFNLEAIYLNGKETDIINPGQTYELYFELVNKSNSSIENLHASLNIENASVSVTPDSIPLPLVGAGEKVPCGPFTIEVLSDIYSSKQEDQKDLFGYVGFSLKISQVSPNPGTTTIDILQSQLRFPMLQIINQTFAVNEDDKYLIVFIDIKNRGKELNESTTQLILNGIGSTKENLGIEDIDFGEQKKTIYGIKLGDDVSLNEEKLTGCLKVKNVLGEVPLNIEMANPFISVSVVKSDKTSIIFEKNVDVELKPGDQNTPPITRPTDENGRTSFSQEEVGSSAEVTLSLPGRNISRTLPISQTKKHHCSLNGALAITHNIRRENIDN